MDNSLRFVDPIKSLKSPPQKRAKVHNRNRKVFMLIDLEPSKEVSGGVGCIRDVNGNDLGQ